jgi:putative addiction module CopG family antidote
VNIALSPELEKFVSDQVANGRFSSTAEVICSALRALETDPIRSAPVFPPGSLAEVFTPEANSAEEKTAAANSLEAEEW